MSDWERAYCETNGIRLHYTRTGGNKPPLILLHGLMTNGLCWSHIARVLETDYDVIMPDARGHGLSGKPGHGYQYEDHASDIIGFISALQLPAPVLLGHSMGGMTAAVVASRIPAALCSVILADPTFLSPAVQQEVYESDVAAQHQKILGQSLEELIAAARIRHPKRSPEITETYANARLQTSMAAFDVLRPPNPDYRELIRRIDIPTLLLFGDKGVVQVDMAEELQQLNPRLQAGLIRDAGHSLHMDQPEEFIMMMKTFLNTGNCCG
ncbi:MAG: alpha/beta hydrolase [Chitinophaga sp.]|uniref:alpha/beta fold hydrolase n=1 Tax=Chitinophaga sp. TaxID=1869181 RepID=UPI001B188336|nr:alpha/beta hydrolase [Chitinophaga sp.]MBO9731452.1 alpha/beta hydrolase [Chitinophaga sp.]